MGISSVNYGGERLLHTIFGRKVSSHQINWEDWKKQIVYATLLYGGFEEEEEVYRAFRDKQLPDGKRNAYGMRR